MFTSNTTIYNVVSYRDKITQREISLVKINLARFFGQVKSNLTRTVDACASGVAQVLKYRPEGKEIRVLRTCRIWLMANLSSSMP